MHALTTTVTVTDYFCRSELSSPVRFHEPHLGDGDDEDKEREGNHDQESIPTLLSAQRRYSQHTRPCFCIHCDRDDNGEGKGGEEGTKKKRQLVATYTARKERGN